MVAYVASLRHVHSAAGSSVHPASRAGLISFLLAKRRMYMSMCLCPVRLVVLCKRRQGSFRRGLLSSHSLFASQESCLVCSATSVA